MIGKCSRRGFLQFGASDAFLQKPGAEMDRHRKCKQGDTAHAKERRIIGLPGCECALRGQSDGEKHKSRHRPAHGAIGSVICH